MEGCATTWVGWEVTVGVAFHDGMSDLRKMVARSKHLRHELMERFGKIYRQESIDGPELGGTVEFEFESAIKLQGLATR